MVGLDEHGNLHAYDQVSKELEKEGYLETVFEDGKLVKEYSLSKIRRNIDGTFQSSL